ncbi:MAG: hypothetical protein KTR31_21015 [Myxococcales bacterium]|nr:hypothetical protein [Myxococcales bacterium]
MRSTSIVVLAALGGCVSDSGIQGVEPPFDYAPAPAVDRSRTITDAFTHTVNTPMADVLWVIDGSGSMADDLAILADQFPVFMQIIDQSTVDYRVAVTGTNLSQLGRLMTHSGGKKWIDRETASPINAYVSLISQASSGGASGFNFDATYGCLNHETGDCHISDFRRDDAPVHTIVVTDERDTSDIGPTGFVNWYRTLDEHPPNRQFSGILALRNTGAYVTAIEQIGGVVREVNGADWTELLQEFANRTRTTAEKREFYLSNIPVEDTIEVEVRPLELGDVVTPPLAEDKWLYDPYRNSVWVDTDELPEGNYRTFLTYDVRTAIID